MPSRTDLTRRLGIEPHEQITFTHTHFRCIDTSRAWYKTTNFPFATTDARFADVELALGERLENFVAFSRALDAAGISNMVVDFDGRVAVNGAAL